MLEKQGIYTCENCRIVVEVLNGGNILSCCGKPLQKLTANTVEASKEKHIPVLDLTSGTLVKVGSAEHPMENDHYIEWIAVRTVDGKTGRKFLKAGDKPEAEFGIAADKIVELSAYCNKHGLWSAKVR